MAQEETYKYSFKMEPRTASLFVQNTGCQRCAGGYRWGPGIRDHYLIHHVLSGKGYLEIGEKTYRLQKGDTFLTFPNTSILYYADEEEPWEYVWAGFNGVEAQNLVSRTDFGEDCPVLYGFFAHEIAGLLMDLYSDYGTMAWCTPAITGRLYLLLAFLIRNAQRDGQTEHSERDYAGIAAGYIMTHYEQPITVESLAQLVSISQSSLYRCFRRKFNMSPKRFILEYRIERACALLKENIFSIREISNSVGFEDPLYFFFFFKLVKGMSPRSWAALQRDDGE